MRALSFVLLGCLAACGGDEPAPQGAGTQVGAVDQAPQLEPLVHDLGTVPHGESRQHDYVFDLSRLPHAQRHYVPLRAHIDCSCGRTQVLIVDKDGKERLAEGRPNPDNEPGPGDKLVVRLFFDTRTKDAVDLPATQSRGFLLLQPLGDRDGSQRVSWPFFVRFAIDSPVVLRPFAEFDFGRVPQSATPTIETTLRGDEHHAGITFGEVTSTSPAITATLMPSADDFVLRARCTPGELGNHSAVVQVATDLARGYSVNLGVKWKVVPDLEASPIAKLSFRADLSREQAAKDAASQFVLVVDHDERRPSDFVVREITSLAGNDARAHFAVTLEPVPGSSRQQRMFVRCLGGLAADFRGRVVLAKPGDAAGGPELPIELVAFHRP